MGAKAYLGRFDPDLEGALGEAVSKARRDAPYSPVTVLVGSNLLGAYLKRRLADRLEGLFNVRFVTFVDAAAIVAGAGSLAGRALLPPHAERVIVERLVAAGNLPPSFGKAAGTKGFGEALASTFADLAESGCTPEIARRIASRPAPGAGVGERARAVLSLYASFRDAVERLGGDVHSLFVDALSRPIAPALGARVLAYGFYDMNEMQWRLLHRIAAECDLVLFMPWGEKETYRFCEPTRKKLEENGFEIAAVSGAPRVTEDAPRPKLLSVPGEEEEVREIARRILALARRDGVRFGDVAVLVPSMESYGCLLTEVLDEAGIPYFLGAGSSAKGAVSARGALGLLRLLGGTMERRELVEFLVSAPLRSEHAGAETFDRISRWVRKSAEAGVIGDKGWVEESGALVDRLKSEVETGEESQESLASALHVDSLIRKIAAAASAARKVSTWADHGEVVSTLVRELFQEGEDTENVCGVIAGLAELDRIGAPQSFESFFRIAESELTGFGLPVGRFAGDGVNILTLVQARGLAFKAVFMPGLAERVFPTAARQDPFLSDAERGELARLTGGEVSLSEKGRRLSEEALLFEIALGAAREEVVLSFPRFEEGTGKERIPSSFLRFVEGYSFDGAHGDKLDGEWISRGDWGRRDGELVSEHEFDLARASELLSGSGAYPESIFFSRGARLVKGRWGARTFTEYDGVFSSQKAFGELRAMLEERGRRFAPTALEVYAACPFDYYLSRVLGIEVLEEPERILAITPLQRGTLIHRILARVFGQLKKEGLLPVRESPAERVFEVAERVVARVLDDFPRIEPIGLPVFWEMEKRLVKESIRLLLEEERFEEGSFVPSYFEKSFGREDDGLDVSCECGGRQVLFYGRIDRIDVGAGRAFRVIDYKTGKLIGSDQDLEHGTALQLPVYLMAASRILGLPIEEGNALYRHVGPGENKKAIVFSGARWETNRGEFAKVLGAIIQGIERGIFFAPANDEVCRNCAVRMACPAGTPRLFALKAVHDDHAREYLALREESGEEE